MCCQLDHTTTKTQLIIASLVISFMDTCFYSGHISILECTVTASILISPIVLSHFTPMILWYYQWYYSTVSLFFTSHPCYVITSHIFLQWLLSPLPILPFYCSQFVVLTFSTSRLYNSNPLRASRMERVSHLHWQSVGDWEWIGDLGIVYWRDWEAFAVLHLLIESYIIAY